MAHYDQFADDFAATRKSAWPEFDLILPCISKNTRLLDLGCGNARFRKFLDQKLVPAGNYFGLDASEKLLKIARADFPTDHFFHHNFEKEFPFGSENFETVVSIAAFHHLYNKKDQLHFLSECHRVLKPGGTVFLTTWKLPMKYFWTNLLRFRWKNWLIPFGKDRHPRIYRRVDDAEMSALLEKSGFEVVRSELFRGRNYIVIARKV